MKIFAAFFSKVSSSLLLCNIIIILICIFCILFYFWRLCLSCHMLILLPVFSTQWLSGMLHLPHLLTVWLVSTVPVPVDLTPVPCQVVLVTSMYKLSLVTVCIIFHAWPRCFLALILPACVCACTLCTSAWVLPSLHVGPHLPNYYNNYCIHMVVCVCRFHGLLCREAD